MKIWNKKYKIICPIIIVLCAILFIFCCYNNKININTASVNVIKIECNSIKGLSDKTTIKLIENRPYKNITDISNIKNIGTKRYKLVSKYFCTHNTLYWKYLNIVKIFSIIFAIFIIIVWINKSYHMKILSQYQDKIDNYNKHYKE